MTRCKDANHYPPTMAQRVPGKYRHACPTCGAVTRWEVGRLGCRASNLRATRAQLVELLIQARAFDNQTVRDSGQMAVWRRKVDQALQGEPGDDPAARWNEPGRMEHRAFIERLFRPGG